jgi:hypothetical protein
MAETYPFDEKMLIGLISGEIIFAVHNPILLYFTPASTIILSISTSLTRYASRH